jgi:hypothetical protein
VKKNILAFGIFLLVVFVFLTVTTVITVKPVLADVNDTVTIDVNVTATASIAVYPETLNWTSVATGAAGGLKYLTVKNTGSLNVSNIYSYVDTLVTESARPYGSSDPKAYSAGGVIAIKNESAAGYSFAGRLEWNWTQDIPNHVWGAVTSPTSWGYFRNTSNDYVWVLGNGTAGRCNESSAQFSVETDVDLGTAATRTPDNTFSIITSAGDPQNWGYASITTGPLTGYCVAAKTDCSKIYIYKYDKRTNFTGCGGAFYLQSGNLVPGSTTILSLDAWVPNGYPSGFLNQTVLTVYATSS